ncbi:prepilin-type N-terminal cleavage/methylation domain-containing protein [bacterium]|nr:prepilin-type N-terminal cleavage/methylation domain-containing protein [bacterium]
MKRHAFTMLELLMVVAIIAILAAIAVPNFLEAQTRSKVARVRMDMADTSAALEAYMADWRSYPVHQPGIALYYRAITIDRLQRPLAGYAEDVGYGWGGGWGRGDVFDAVPPGFLETSQKDQVTTAALKPAIAAAAGSWALTRLTTPTAYLAGTVPLDVFADERTRPLTYINVADLDAEFPAILERVQPRRFVLLSFGPDVDSNSVGSQPAGATEYPISKSTLHPVIGPYLPYDPTNGTISRGELYGFGVQSLLSPIEAPKTGEPPPPSTPDSSDPFGGMDMGFDSPFGMEMK